MARKRVLQEKCQNCGNQLEKTDNYCRYCGQENHSPNQAFKHLLAELFESITHLDSKIFLTYKNLFLKPGLYSKEYIENKRNRYIPPIRLYIFISALFFFLLQFLGSHHSSSQKSSDLKSNQKSTPSDSITQNDDNEFHVTVHGNKLILSDSVINYLQYGGQAAVDSFIVQNEFTPNYFSRLCVQQIIKSELAGKSFSGILFSKGLKYLSILLFLLMPIFGLILNLFHFRWRRNYYEYLILAINYHTLYFTTWSFVILISFFYKLTLPFYFLIFVCLFIYLMIGLKNYFKQSTWLSFFKSFAICSIYGFVLLLGVALSFILGWFSF